MKSFDEIARHYSDDDLLETIAEGVTRLGKSIYDLAVEDLAPVDEFHIGGAAATRAFLENLGVEAHDHVLDVGCSAPSG